jgi:hypothetical protein
MVRKIQQLVYILFILNGFVYTATDSLTVREYIHETNPYYLKHSVPFYPDSTAIILIDLWDREVVDPLVNRINPLIEMAREKGITIIHAPSQRDNIMHPDIRVDTADVLITGYDDLGDILNHNGINTLLYIGNDVAKCVLDKPLGAINYHINNNSDYRYILINDATTSAYHETYLLGINIFEKAFGLSTTISYIFEAYNLKPPDAVKNDIQLPHYNESKNLINIFSDYDNIYSAETAIVLFPSLLSGSQENTRLNEIIEWADELNMMVVQTSISEKYKNLYVVESEKEFIKLIKINNIQNLLYAGVSLDEKMIWGPTGFLRMYIQKRFKNNPMPKCYVIKDYALISSKTLIADSDLIKSALLKHYRQINSISFSQLKKKIRTGIPQKYSTEWGISYYVSKVMPKYSPQIKIAFKNGGIIMVLKEVIMWMLVFKWVLLTYGILFTLFVFILKRYLLDKLLD